MRRIVPLIAVTICVASTAGCGSLGWYRAAGDIPGIAPSDYAYYDFCGTSAQLFPFSPPQVERSAIEGLGDLGFRLAKPPIHEPSGTTFIDARTPDGRPAKITISPQNSLTSVKVEIGPIHAGDGELSRDFFRRIALNYGTGLRVYTPVDRTLAKRGLMPSGFIPQFEHTPPLTLKGDGLRPNESVDRVAPAEGQVPGQETAPASALPALLQGLMQGGGSQGPYFPGVPYPVPPNPYLPFQMPSVDQN
jgi:hypothetical protein